MVPLYGADRKGWGARGLGWVLCSTASLLPVLRAVSHKLKPPVMVREERIERRCVGSSGTFKGAAAAAAEVEV